MIPLPGYFANPAVEWKLSLKLFGLLRQLRQLEGRFQLRREGGR